MANSWKSRGCIAAVLMFFLTAGAVVAQNVYIEQNVEMPAMAGQPPTQMLVKIWFTPDKMRIDQPLGGGTTVIMRTDLGKMWIINNASKTYMDRSLEDAKSAAASAAAMMGGDKMQVEVKPTGATKKIGDWNCQEYDLSVKGGTPLSMRIWATPDVTIDPQLYAKMSEAMGSNPMMTSLTDKIKSIPGYPIQSIMTMTMGGQELQSTSTIQKISQEKIDPSVFELPAGYTKVEAPAAAQQAPAPAPAAPATEAPAPKKGGS